jgi:hypothetical protein
MTKVDGVGLDLMPFRVRVRRSRPRSCCEAGEISEPGYPQILDQAFNSFAKLRFGFQSVFQARDGSRQRGVIEVEAPCHPAPRDSAGAKGDICGEMASRTRGATLCRTEKVFDWDCPSHGIPPRIRGACGVLS